VSLALILAIALLVAATVLCFLELFVPSMGIITTLGLLCVVGSCWSAFTVGANTGWLFVALNVVGVILGFGLAFKYMPRSPMALRSSKVEEGGYEPVEAVGDLVGKTGVAFTILRPGGTALIEGRKIDVVASGGYIEKDARIKVIAIEGTKVTVEREVL
jgi:membrane-bound serine protease (ClpP class)